MNDLLLSISKMCLTILALLLLLRRLKQPYLIAYIFAGILLGPYVSKTFTRIDEIEAIGEIGILLLMFFLGMEIDIPDKRSLLMRPMIAQGMKITLSIFFALMTGMMAQWPMINTGLLAILFIFNSTAVVSEYLRTNGELHTFFGKTILNILLLQDILLAPVLTLLQLAAHHNSSAAGLIIPLLLTIFLLLILRRIRNNRRLINPYFIKNMEQDHELQVFAGLLICLGFGALASLSGLSSPLGSFIAGILIGQLKAFNWLEKSLKPFKIFFVALFFISIGLRFDVPFFTDHARVILTGTLFVLFSNSVLSALVFRLLKYNWKSSFYGGAMLSQTGEFGLLALSVAFNLKLIGSELYKTGLAITALSLLCSTLWISVFRTLFFHPKTPGTGKLINQNSIA